MFLDTILVIQTVYFGLDFIMMLPGVLNLHAIQMSVTWQNVHNAKIVNSL